MRGAPRRSGELLRVSARAFAWDAATIATLRHVSLPWHDAVDSEMAIVATPLAAAGEIGPRDRLSLVAQAAAHQAFLQFAGIADGPFHPSEWAISRKRGSDCRLIRIGAGAADAADAPPVLSIIHDFAGATGGVSLAVLRQSWARAESVFGEAFAALQRHATADLRWTRLAAIGTVLSPGADALRAIWRGVPGRSTYCDGDFLEAVHAMAALDPGTALTIAESQFSLHRYSALGTLDPSVVSSTRSEGEVAELLSARLSSSRHVIVIARSIDEPSRRAAEIASRLGAGHWVLPSDDDVVESRHFVVSPRLAARKSIEQRMSVESNARQWLADFAASDALSRYVERGDLPPGEGPHAAVPEPKRSYIAALALLGTSMERGLASSFLASFLFDQQLDDLILPNVTELDASHFRFCSNELREQFARHIPSASRPALCRAAASLCGDEQAASLLIDAGDFEEGVRRLEHVSWSSSDAVIAALARLPSTVLTPSLAMLLADAYIEGGRYREARALASQAGEAGGELILARTERRAGDYATALRRLERLTVRSFAHDVLRCELLRLTGCLDDARSAIASLVPATEEERLSLAYERAVLDLDCGLAPAPLGASGHYLGARLDTYIALLSGDFAAAEGRAAEALARGRSNVEKIDAWLDRIFAAFSTGRWDNTRTLALEALTLVEETDGDRAAAGILYTLAFLAADEGQWKTAEQMIQRLRYYYSATEDGHRLFEINLLTAHLDFSRGRLDEARRLAEGVVDKRGLLPQIREAAALIVDEVDVLRGAGTRLRSNGRSWNRELSDRHKLLAGETPVERFNAALALWLAGRGAEPEANTRSQKLKLFRAALRLRSIGVATRLAAELDVELPADQAPVPSDIEILRTAATADYPFHSDVFGPVRWCFASRNRLNHWSVEGNIEMSPAQLDAVAGGQTEHWIVCSERELLFVEGLGGWPVAAREAVAALFRTRDENHRLRRITAHDGAEPLVRCEVMHGVVGESQAIRSVFESVDRIARRDVAVCVLGESGTGKELVARAIHRASSRRQKQFTAVNCAALPENLIESELFGHARGAFTGADRDRPGLIESTDGGTLFLDEIGELPLLAQAKLLRFLQDGEFRRVGDVTNRSADVRIVSATNRRLESAVEEGRFREDLYYRVRGVEIQLPALRDRGSDVALLARHFLAAERVRHRSGPAELSPEVEMLFRSYRWPGNVRELQNTIRAAHAMAGERRQIEIEHLPERLRTVVPARVMSGSYQEAVSRFRRDLIEKSLLEADGNQKRAAAMLNMSRQALAYQIHELGIMVRKSARPAL